MSLFPTDNSVVFFTFPFDRITWSYKTTNFSKKTTRQIFPWCGGNIVSSYSRHMNGRTFGQFFFSSQKVNNNKDEVKWKCVSGRRKKGGPPSSPCRVEEYNNLRNSRFSREFWLVATTCVEAFKPSARITSQRRGDSNQVQLLKKAGFLF